MTTQLREAIARLRRHDWAPDDDDIDLICDALEASLTLGDMVKAAPKFDKVAYQREYMRRRRAEEKLVKCKAEMEAEREDRLYDSSWQDF